MTPRHLTILSALLLVLTSGDPAQAQTEKPILGIWQITDGKGAVEFYPCGDSVCGRLYNLGTPDPGPTTRAGQDSNNKDSAKRTRPLCGLTFMGGFEPQPDGSFENGWIYSPRHGAKFSADLALTDANTLKLRGYMMFSFMGEDQIWTRASAAIKPCQGLLPVSMTLD